MQNDNYRPNPPKTILAIYDNESQEIILFWQLPSNTFGDMIQYKVTVGNLESVIIDNFPFYIDYNDKEEIEIVTICDIQNKK